MTLTRIRDVLASKSSSGFPVTGVEEAMAAVGKGLTFAASEIDELLNLKYAGQRTFSVLSVLTRALTSARSSTKITSSRNLDSLRKGSHRRGSRRI